MAIVAGKARGGLTARLLGSVGVGTGTDGSDSSSGRVWG